MHLKNYFICGYLHAICEATNNIISHREKLKSLKHLIKLIARPKMSHGTSNKRYSYKGKDRCTFISCLRKCDIRNRQTQTHLIAIHIHSRSFSRVQHACCEEERSSYPHEVFRSNRDYKI